jgi:hypothetical protein
MTRISQRTCRRIVAAISVALATCGLALGTVAVAEPYAPKVGQKHPDFTLPRIDNRAPVSLSDFLGKKVLLIQFASW